MYALVTAAAVSVAPTPLDLLTASADLHAPTGASPLAERSPRARVAALLALHQLGGLDAGAADARWFHAELGWEGEHDCARRVVAAVRAAPVEDWLPPREWFAAESAAYYATAERWRKRAADYRERVEFEGHQAEALLAWARHFDAGAEAYSAAGCRYNGWAGTSWQRPRRVVLAEAREWLGEKAWERRAWPGE